MTDLKELIQIIKTGAPQEVKAAQKRVEKLWNQACFSPELEKEFDVFVQEAANFEKISDMEHRAYFINTLKWPLWTDRLEHVPFWIEFLIACVRSPEGKIRLAAVHAAEYIVQGMSGYFKNGGLFRRKEASPEQVRVAKTYFCVFAMKAEGLINEYHKPEFNRCKYISALPPGIYKSAQQLLNQAILPSDYYKNIYTEFLRELDRRAALPDIRPGHA